MQFKNFVPYFFRNGFHHFFGGQQFCPDVDWGEKVNFCHNKQRFSQDVHNCVGFSAATLAGDKQAKIFIQEIAKASSLCGRFCIIIWNLHFKC